MDFKNGTAFAVGNAGTNDIIISADKVGLNLIDFTESGALVFIK
jgi:hypothetical protein